MCSNIKYIIIAQIFGGHIGSKESNDCNAIIIFFQQAVDLDFKCQFSGLAIVGR